MIKITPTQEQMAYSKNLNNNFNFGKRGRGDGNSKEQYTGILGQVILADFLDLPRIKGESGFDGGIDFIINDRKIDVKTMIRSVDVRPHYSHNFFAYQIGYVTEYYIFQSYNKNKNEMSICGFVSKNELLEKSSFHPEGTSMGRDDGSGFILKSPTYEILQSLLNPINSIDDIFINIR